LSIELFKQLKKMDEVEIEPALAGSISFLDIFPLTNFNPGKLLIY